MTERMIENRIKKLSALEEQIAQLQEQADAVKGGLKADLEEKGLDRWKEIVSNRIDGKALTQAVANNGFPFEIKRVEHNPHFAMNEEMLLKKLERSRVSTSQGNYKSEDTVIADMRSKYGI